MPSWAVQRSPLKKAMTGLRLIIAAGLLLGQGSWTVRFAGVSRQTKRRTDPAVNPRHHHP
jgi:hypothetical protein